MRPLTITIICVMAGCSRTAFEPTGLDLDEEIRKLAKFDIDRTSGGVRAVPCLDVVPNGETSPRATVFKALKLDDVRLRDFREESSDFVVYLTWQVSPTYDICCMTAINDLDNDGLETTDPRRKVYGIRLVKGPK